MDQLTVQVHVNESWQDAGTIKLLDSPSLGLKARTKFTYDIDYAVEHLEERGQSAASLGLPVRITDQSFPGWPPFLLDLFPEGAALKYIEKIYQLEINEANYWNVLNKVVVAPPGNVRLRPNQLAETNSKHKGFPREDILDKRKDFLEHMIRNGAAIGGATAAQGGAPKFLLREDHQGRFHADLALGDQDTARCWLVKFPRGSREDDFKILAHEAIYIKIARTLGIRTQELPIWERDCLFVQRFDRLDQPLKYIGLESLSSASGIADFGVPTHHETFLKVIAKQSSHPAKDILEYLQREVLNTSMGNTDNHGRNTAFMKINEEVRLAPLYDFAPMQFDPELIAPSTTWKNQPFDLSQLDSKYQSEVFEGFRNFTSNLIDLEHLMIKEGVDKTYIDKTHNQRRDLTELLQTKFL